jgi:hypothetical protein
MIAINTILLVLVLYMAWRRSAWGVAILAFILGTTASGPIAQAANTAWDAILAVVNALGSLA